jgi:hypothetical protein
MAVSEAVAELLAAHGISQDQGFIGLDEPAVAFSNASLGPWDALAPLISQFLGAGCLADNVDTLIPATFDTSLLADDRERRRALLILGALAHGYVFEPLLEASPGVPRCVLRANDFH